MKGQDFYNPFSTNRAEHLGEDLYRYFAGANILGNMLSPKSLVLVGGRGSGKTMFFIYNSYQSKKREHYDENENRSHILEQESVLGIYLKAEPDLVTGFCRKGRDEEWWLGLFGHYLNVRVCSAMCAVAVDLKQSDLVQFDNEANICVTIARNFGFRDVEVNTFEALQQQLESSEDEVLLYINNIDRVFEPIKSHPSRGMRQFAQRLATDIGHNLAFHVFIDEFENLESYQQGLVNSFIKNPDQYLVFDIGVKKNGFKTYNTLVGTEQISPWNDYYPFDIEEEIGNKDSYDSFIKEICLKRLRTVPELQSCTDGDARLSIDYYLGSYDLRKEVQMVVSGNRPPPYLKDLKELLQKVGDEKRRQDLFDAFTNDPDPVINRMNLVLLLQRKNPDYILSELEKFREGQRSKYKDWLHNYGVGTVFLLCKDYRQRKRYFGYDTYLQLSSGIPRYFIQLCFYAFDYAHRSDNFVFGSEDRVSIDSQDRAAYHLSVNKVDEIDSYPPVGRRLKRLTLLLGRIFEQLHKRPRISEPESNHFWTNYDSIADESKEILDSGVMWAVFQARPLTKIKSDRQARGSEYHLNHIYAPYFQISYRRKRRLDIAAEDFDKLVDGNDQASAQVAQKLIGKIKLDTLSDLLEWEDLQPYQMNLWSLNEDQQDI
ncbi:MAG: hypothetical protein ACLFPU_08090 [Dehalococcoidia bacterium]